MPGSGELVGAERHPHPLGAVLYDCAVRTHLWVAAAVTSLAGFAAHQLEYTPSLAALGVVCFSTLLIYNLDTAIDLKSPRSVRSARAAQSVRSTRAAWGESEARQKRALRLALFALVAVLALLTTLHWTTTTLVATGAAICCLYAVPLGSRGYRMKALPGAKSFVVGSAVAIAVVFVPLVEHGGAWPAQCWPTLALIATLTLVNATLFDVRDLEHDRAFGVRTLPVILGQKTTRFVLGLSATASLGVLATLEPRLRQSAWLLLGTLLPLIAWLSPRSPKSAYAWLVDGALFLPWLLSLR